MVVAAAVVVARCHRLQMARPLRSDHRRPLRWAVPVAHRTAAKVETARCRASMDRARPMPRPRLRAPVVVASPNPPPPGTCANVLGLGVPSRPRIGTLDTCVVAASSITLSGLWQFTGSHPVVLIARTTITIDTIDVGSHGGMIGAGMGPC